MIEYLAVIGTGMLCYGLGVYIGWHWTREEIIQTLMENLPYIGTGIFCFGLGILLSWYMDGKK